MLIILLALLLQPTLTYGDTLSGTINDVTSSHTYTFTGAAGDVIVIVMLSVNRELDNPLDAPVLILQAPDGATLADTTLAYPFDDTFIVMVLPISGPYTITATRDENIQFLSHGDFTLSLNLVPELPDTPIDTISNEDFAHYYYIQPDAPLTLDYTRLSGEFSPQITVNRITETGLQPIAVASGSALTEATLGTFPPDETYIIMLNMAPFDYQPETVFAEYQLIPR